MIRRLALSVACVVLAGAALAVAPVVASATAATAGSLTAVAPKPVTAAGVIAATTTSLTLQWTNPSGSGFAGVVIRRARGTKAPGFTGGTLVASTAKSVTSFTVKGLAPATRYTFALFARGARGKHAPAAAAPGTTNPSLKITTAALPPGTAGMRYQAALAASGGTPPYTWKAAGLPKGLFVAANGTIVGYPAATGTAKVAVTVTDAQHTSRTTALTVAVPSALPAGCAARACAQLSADGKTVQVPAADIGAVTRDPADRAVTRVALSGITVTDGDVLVLAPGGGLPSGLIAVAGAVTANGDGTSTVAVTPATPADAYDGGTVQALPGSTASGKVTIPYLRGTDARTRASAPGSAATSLKCSGTVSSSLHGLSITHTMTPSLAAIWKHPYFGGGGVYVGSGGLSLFQFDLDGTISLNMGITVSGAATCTLTLPELEADVPAGDLGAVIFTTQPSVTFTVTGEIDVRSTVTLSCGAEYRWDNGVASRAAYCLPSETPLRLSADSGLNATLKGTLDAAVTLDDIAGITGDIWAQLHAGYHPATHPVAELDASAGYDLGACLTCFWPGSPAKVTIGSGTFFSKTIATYDNPPAATPPVIVGTTLPGAATGQSYSTQLTTADHRAGTWKITAGKLPPGVSLSGHTIGGKPETAGTYGFTLAFTDTHGQTATAKATLTVAVGWAYSELPVPANIGGDTEPGLDGVSCPSASFCVAVGSYSETSGAIDGMLLTRSDGVWTAARAPLPAGATGAGLNAVSCSSASFCTAVGYYDWSGGQDPLLLSWSGRSWTVVPAPLPADSASLPSANLEAVSCASASFCAAVGLYGDGSGGHGPLILTWSGRSWTVAPAPLPGDSASPASGSLDAVSCPSASFCVAGGTYAGTDTAALMLTWADGSWTATGPFTGHQGDLSGVSCPSASFCTAVGDYLIPTSTWAYQPKVLTWSGGAWTAAPGPIPSGAVDVTWGSVSCPSSSYCGATGLVNYDPSSFEWQDLERTWSGGLWTERSFPEAPSLVDVSCWSAGDCVVVGTVGPGGGTPIALTSSG